MKTALSLILMLITATAASAADTRPVVVELFTSQGCSSCPPADALLADLAKRGDVVALGYHITYWDGAQWRDPLSRKESTERQADYDKVLTAGQIYTPQIIVEGTEDVVGSDRSAVLATLDKAKPVAAASVTLAPDRRSVTIGAGSAPTGAGVLVARYVLRRSTQVTGGENAGHASTDVNAVTSLKMIAEWNGKPVTLPIDPPGDGEGLAVLIQAPSGKFLGAASTETNPTSSRSVPRA
jgi:hypothetical protein